ncbi:hypothetical protein [Granulicella sp. dw_53]|uniref:hypothetical protein n=1 Tax=Granulicella sp. dw_53 TaxID=2719792 RepID=UPI001BD3F941|nr:hypothetical protein [Granulicella sp. dw_53]
MKRLRHLALVILLLCLIVRPSNGCSPGDPQAIFVHLYGPDASYKAYAAGRLGVILPTFRARHLVIAYDYLNGRPLTPQEQSQAEAAEHAINWQDYRAEPTSEPQPPSPGMHQWIEAHQAAIPGTLNPLTTDRKVPGENYESFTNCLDDAFLNAANTLNARQQAYGKSSPEVLDWIQGQDSVFSNCSNTGSMPDPVPATANLWLKQDRAYQIAAANFYATNYDAALSGFRAIAADHASPWHTIAPYLVARTLIRQTTVGGKPTNDNPDDLNKIKAEQQRLHAGFGTALQQLDAILHDPNLQSTHSATNGLRDFVAARAEPDVQAQRLATRLSSDPHGLDFRHNLIDLTYILTRPTRTLPQGAVKSNPAGLLSFLGTISTPTTPPPPSFYESTPPELPAQTQSRLAIQHTAAQTAYTQWQSTKKPAWLVAALTLAQSSDPFAAELITAAAALPANSPAYTSATYNSLRLKAAAPATRTELLAILPTVERSESRSTINLFAGLLSRTAPTLTDFLKAAPRLPSGSDYEGTIGAPTDIPTPELCGPKLDAAHTPLFDSEAAAILNQRLPLRLLREAAVSDALPPNLRFQLANATLTRAVLLDDPATAAALTPVLVGCQPAMKPWLDRYNAATTPEQRHLQGLFLLMRFPSTEPLVRTGNQRSTGFATYSLLRDNWWAGNTQYIPPPIPAASSTPVPSNPQNLMAVEPEIRFVTPESPNFKPALFFEPIVSASQLPSPSFLTSADSAEAAREVLALQHIPGAADYFSRQALAWVKAHPDDPDNAELLGFATRALRNSSRTSETRELNHQLFLTLQSKYPNSTWAKRYTSWE